MLGVCECGANGLSAAVVALHNVYRISERREWFVAFACAINKRLGRIYFPELCINSIQSLCVVLVCVTLPHFESI